MRLSEAIRLGATLHPQTFGKWYEAPLVHVPLMGETISFPDWSRVKTCAVMGAYIAAGLVRGEFRESPHGLAAESFVVLPESWKIQYGGHCPACDGSVITTGELHHLAHHLNDTHGWSRSEIADAIEAIENRPILPVEKHPLRRSQARERRRARRSQQGLIEQHHEAEMRIPANSDPFAWMR